MTRAGMTRSGWADRGVLIALAVIVGLLLAFSPAFRDPANLLNIGRQIAVLGIAAAAMTLVILMAEIDLSVGAVASAAGVVAAMALAAGWGAWAIPAGIAVGAAFGLMNGLLVTVVAVPSFIATLVSFFIAQGVALTLTGGQTILFDAEGFRAAFATGALFGLRPAVLWMLGVVLVLAWVLHRTRLGAQVYAIGGHAPSARMLGVPVGRVRLAVFAATGALMGLAGLILIARIGNARADAGVGLEFDAIAAVVLGGTALSGGTGTMFRTMLGVATIGILNNALAILNVDYNSQQVIKGVLVVAVVLADQWIRKAGARA
jgi:ribose transport system permease protein